jgi:ankyrin repeat protein
MNTKKKETPKRTLSRTPAKTPKRTLSRTPARTLSRTPAKTPKRTSNKTRKNLSTKQSRTLNFNKKTINKKDVNGRSQLFIAAENGRDTIVQELLDAGANKEL